MARREVELLSPHGDPRNVGIGMSHSLHRVQDNIPTPAPESVLSEAARLVDGDRQTAYGHPKDNHACTAELWSSYISRRYGTNYDAKNGRGGGHISGVLELDAFDVCMLNILQKVSRLAHTRQRDGLVDLAGFARNAEMVDDV